MTPGAPAPLIPANLLERPGKILFITHLAIGDYAYLQNFFKDLAGHFPRLQIHLWVDELRRTHDEAKWERLRKYILYDWLAACPFIKKTYNKTYHPAGFEESVRDARRENYPVIVSLAIVRRHRYAALARKIGPDGFVISTRRGFHLKEWIRTFPYKGPDAMLPASIGGMKHISDVFSCWFERLFGLGLPYEKRFPFIDLPGEWMDYADDFINKIGAEGKRLVFVNTVSKARKRSWPLHNAIEVIKNMRRQKWGDAVFIINTMPEDIAETRSGLAAAGLERAHLFSASDNFFQLPAILGRCALVISVETSVMHLANAVRVPVVALMRLKNPEWRPIDTGNSRVVTTTKRRDWIREIPPERVLRALGDFPARR
jgi:ADP-heptose:LPS heptosyltransferase